jgi:hypothetical protein
MVPWLLALATGVWFGLMARKAGRSWVQWACGGAFFALVIATLVLGLAEASFIPLSHDAEVSHQMKSIMAAVVLVVVPGWLFTMGMHGKLPKLWPRADSRPAPTAPKKL